MAPIDIIGAARDGYRAVWQERRYLVRLAAVPVLIKFTCLVAVLALGWEAQFLRQAVLLLPSYLADGWMASHFVRLIFLGQRWPFRPSGDAAADGAALQDRARGVLGGTLVFALSRFLMAGTTEAAYRASVFTAEPAHTSPIVAVAVLACLILGIWAFRLLWFYIPAALGYSMRRMAADLRGYGTSFYMIGVWLLSFLPVLALLGAFITVLVMPYAGGHSYPPAIEFLAVLARTIADTAVALVSTAAMTFALRAMAAGRPSSAA